MTIISRSEKVRNALKAAQAAQGMTQSDVARRMKVSQTQVSRWLGNPDAMTLGNFRVLCATLGVAPSEIISIK